MEHYKAFISSIQYREQNLSVSAYTALHTHTRTHVQCTVPCTVTSNEVKFPIIKKPDR